jgi:hypothetical protein
VTGSTSPATGTGVALDAAGDQFVTGTIRTAASAFGYVAKYLPGGTTPDATFGSPFTPGLAVFRVSAAGTTYATESHGIAVTSAGAVDVVGSLASPTGTLAYFAQLSSAGDFQADRPPSLFAGQTGTAPNSFNGVALGGADRAVVTGTFSDSAAPDGGLAVAKFDADGSFLTDAFIHLGIRSAGQGIAVNAAGTTAYVAGLLVPSTYPGYTDAFFGKLDVTTEIMRTSFWYITFGDRDDSVFNGVAVNPTPPGEAYFAGTYSEASFLGYSYSLAINADFSNMMDPLVDHYWSTDSLGFRSSAAAVAVGPSGSVYLAGTFRDPMTNQTTIRLTKLDSALNPVGAPVLVGSPTGSGS